SFARLSTFRAGVVHGGAAQNGARPRSRGVEVHGDWSDNGSGDGAVHVRRRARGPLAGDRTVADAAGRVHGCGCRVLLHVPSPGDRAAEPRFEVGREGRRLKAWLSYAGAGLVVTLVGAAIALLLVAPDARGGVWF